MSIFGRNCQIMDILLLLTFSVLGLASILLLWKKDKRLVSIFNVLFGALLLQWAATQLNDTGATAVYVLIAAIVLGFLTAQFVPKKALIGAVVSTVLVSIAYFTSGTGEMTVNENASQAETKFVLTAILLGALAPFIIRLKLVFISKWMPGLKPASWSIAVYSLLAAVGFLISSLTAPVYGPMLVASALLINSFYGDRRAGITAVSVFVLAAVPLLLNGQAVSVSLLNADVIAGVFIGGFSVFLLRKIWSGRNKPAPIIIGYLIVFGVIFGFTSSGKIFEQMGGFDTYIAILVGASVVQAIKGKTYQGVSLFAPVLAFGLLVPNLLKNEEMEEAKQSIITIEGTVSKEGEPQEGPEVLPITELTGDYSIINDQSKIQFSLGDEGAKTNGSFKKVSGKFNFAEDLTKAKVSVELRMEDFTTFNSMRDESLEGDEYFKVDKYPTMKFQGTGFIEKSDNLYEINGEFSMLGVKKPVTVSLQRVKLEDKIVLIGSGSLDRTKFGMTPSAAEGNVVDFNYQVELQK